VVGSLWIPLVAQSKLVGLLALGPRWTGEVYTDADLRLVGILAGQLALALANAGYLERLRQLPNLVRQVEENERQKIARELHDTTLQFLLVLTFGLDELKNGEPTRDRQVDAWQDRISAEAERIRDLIGYLRSPQIVVRQGLAYAISNWLDQVRAQTAIRIETTIDPTVDASLAPEVQAVLYRVFREAVHNAIKHSGARQVNLSLQKEEARAVFVIQDDGRGFDVAEAMKGAEKGYSSLQDMRVTIQSVGGEVSIGSQPGGGTVIHGWAPAG
jgi:signal transduction histidine kinase